MKLIYPLVLFIFFSCSSSKNINQKNIEIEYYKDRKKPTTVLVVKTFDFEQEKSRIPAFVEVNDIIFKPNSFDSDIVIYLNPGKYNLEVILIGKEIVSVKNLNVALSDSIVVNVFLKDSFSPLVD